MAEAPAEVPRKTKMTNEQNAKICTALAGYEVQVSPAGKWYVVTGNETKLMPDFETDSAETLSTVEALCKSRGYSFSVVGTPSLHYMARVHKAWASCITITSAVAHCLLQIAEGG